MRKFQLDKDGGVTVRSTARLLDDKLMTKDEMYDSMNRDLAAYSKPSVKWSPACREQLLETIDKLNEEVELQDLQIRGLKDKLKPWQQYSTSNIGKRPSDLRSGNGVVRGEGELTKECKKMMDEVSNKYENILLAKPNIAPKSAKLKPALQKKLDKRKLVKEMEKKAELPHAIRLYENGRLGEKDIDAEIEKRLEEYRKELLACARWSDNKAVSCPAGPTVHVETHKQILEEQMKGNNARLPIVRWEEKRKDKKKMFIDWPLIAYVTAASVGLIIYYTC